MLKEGTQITCSNCGHVIGICNKDMPSTTYVKDTVKFFDENFPMMPYMICPRCGAYIDLIEKIKDKMV